MTTTPFANAKWFALSVTCVASMSVDSVKHSVLDVGVTPADVGMVVNSSPQVLFTAANNFPSEACTAAPNARLSGPGPRPSEFCTG